MRAIRLESIQPPTLVEDNVPEPKPSAGGLLIRVHAAGVTTAELNWYPTSHDKSGTNRSRAIPGHEFSGVVAAIGERVTGFEVGQAVYGMNDWYSDGAMAEYCVTQPSYVAPKPSSLTHVQAASVPIGGLTAWQGLFDRAKLRSGERLLVHGGAGSVGAFAVQLGRIRGAHVVATASAHNCAFVEGLGAEQVIDYRANRFEELVAEMDVVFDTAGGDTLERSWHVLKPGGRMVTIVSGGANSSSERVRRAFFIVEPNPEELTEVGDLIEASHLQPVVDAVVPFAHASAAYTGPLAEQRNGRGKLVVSVAAVGSSAV